MMIAPSTDKAAPRQTTTPALLRDARLKSVSLLDGVTLLSLLIYLFTTASYIRAPLLDQHAFRQCQTAISVPWLASDLDPRRMFAYETPILGAPWRVPFEFPLYQWLTAVTVRLSGWRVDLACRAVSAMFHLACLWPLWRIVRSSGRHPRLWKITTSLFLLSPVLHHWSRAALIETTAVYLALEYLALMVAWAQRPSAWLLVGATVFAVLGVLVKVTTFPPFAVAAGITCLLSAWPRLRGNQGTFSALLGLALAVLPLGVAIGCLVPWLEASDAAKRLNPIAAYTTSAALESWNYGTVMQKLSTQLWIGTILLRAIPESIGWAGFLVLITGLVGLDRRTKLVACTLTGLYLLAFLLFTNLHMVHNYYQTANALWLVAALATVVDKLFDVIPRPASMALMLLCLGGQVYQSLLFYLPIERLDFSRDARIAALPGF